MLTPPAGRVACCPRRLALCSRFRFPCCCTSCPCLLAIACPYLYPITNLLYYRMLLFHIRLHCSICARARQAVRRKGPIFLGFAVEGSHMGATATPPSLCNAEARGGGRVDRLGLHLPTGHRDQTHAARQTRTHAGTCAGILRSYATGQCKVARCRLRE